MCLCGPTKKKTEDRETKSRSFICKIENWEFCSRLFVVFLVSLHCQLMFLKPDTPYDTTTTNRKRVVIRDMSAVVDRHLSVFRGRFSIGSFLIILYQSLLQ